MAEFPEGRLRYVSVPVADQCSAGQGPGPSYVDRLQGMLATAEPAKDPDITRVSRTIRHFARYALLLNLLAPSQLRLLLQMQSCSCLACKWLTLIPWVMLTFQS